MLAAPSRDWNVFKQIFADRWPAFQQAHPRYQRAYYDDLVAKMLACGNPDTMGYLEGYNTHMAHPCRWTYTGQPLVRATPSSQTRRQQRPGRAWFRARPKPFERAFYPPRPYKRAAA